MKQLLFSLVIFTLLQNCTENTTNQSVNQPPVAVQTVQTAEKDQLLRHVVLFKFKDEATAADVKKVEDAFRDLPNHISEIKAFEWGTNNSPEGLAEGFTHCFFVSFANEEGRAIYLPNPKHQ